MSEWWDNARQSGVFSVCPSGGTLISTIIYLCTIITGRTLILYIVMLHVVYHHCEYTPLYLLITKFTEE